MLRATTWVKCVCVCNKINKKQTRASELFASHLSFSPSWKHLLLTFQWICSLVVFFFFCCSNKWTERRPHMPGVCWVFLATLVSLAGRARAHMCVFINLWPLSLPYVSHVPGARHRGRVTHVQSWHHTLRQTAATRASSVMHLQIGRDALQLEWKSRKSTLKKHPSKIIEVLEVFEEDFCCF